MEDLGLLQVFLLPLALLILLPLGQVAMVALLVPTITERLV